jgi:V/A-type H+-transporting ATPase subunit F
MFAFVIGDSDMITGFRLVGVEGAEVTSAEDAWQALNQALKRSDLGIIIISEQFSTETRMHETIDKVRRQSRSPLIVELPGSKGKPSEVRMSDLISKILGIRI